MALLDKMYNNGLIKAVLNNKQINNRINKEIDKETNTQATKQSSYQTNTTLGCAR